MCGVCVCLFLLVSDQELIHFGVCEKKIETDFHPQWEDNMSVAEQIDKTRKYYSEKLDITIELPKELIKDINKRGRRMSGCFSADYINHKVYAFLFEYVLDNDLDCDLPQCYVDYQDIQILLSDSDLDEY